MHHHVKQIIVSDLKFGKAPNKGKHQNLLLMTFLLKVQG